MSKKSTIVKKLKASIEAIEQFKNQPVTMHSIGQLANLTECLLCDAKQVVQQVERRKSPRSKAA